MPWRKGEEELHKRASKPLPHHIDPKHYSRVKRRYPQARVMEINYAVKTKMPIPVGAFEIPEKVARYAFTIIERQKYQIKEIVLRRKLLSGGIEERTYDNKHGHPVMVPNTLKIFPSTAKRKK